MESKSDDKVGTGSDPTDILKQIEKLQTMIIELSKPKPKELNPIPVGPNLDRRSDIMFRVYQHRLRTRPAVLELPMTDVAPLTREQKLYKAQCIRERLGLGLENSKHELELKKLQNKLMELEEAYLV